MGKKKKDGKIFTPEPIVKHMLYNEMWRHHELDQHIIDNSCGDGAFLREIVDHYCDVYNRDKENGKGMDLKTILETYIHGIEIDPVEHKKCLENLDAIAEKYGISGVKWDVQNRDALSCHDYDGKMDYVIANPPYIRTHDLECDLSGYSFASDGMKDIYLAFYELGFRMLNECGTMCYITPSSWFTSLAGQKMRDYIMETKYLHIVHDFGHTQVFENATTYVSICVFRKAKDPNWLRPYVWYVKGKNGVTVHYDDMCIDGKFYFGTPEQLKQMREIIEYGKGTKRQNKVFQVKNGFATLADDVFIPKDKQETHRVYHSVRPWNIIPVIKSSTGKQEWCYYPYSKTGKLMNENEIDEVILNTLAEHKEKLEERATTEPWYAFGRTQAINDTWKEKWAIKSLIKTFDDVKPVEAPAGTGVYGGLYILTEHPEGLKALETEEFMNYVKMLGKYKSGGYYTFSSKELENYLNWSYGKKKN
jgi:adenine-specific DNA-methyltransferase